MRRLSTVINKRRRATHQWLLFITESFDITPKTTKQTLIVVFGRYTKQVTLLSQRGRAMLPVCQRLVSSLQYLERSRLFTSDNGGGIWFRPRTRVRLSVCLCARLLKNGCVDLDEMLRVDRCQTWTNWLTFEPDPDHGPDSGTGFFSPIAYALQRGVLLRRENPYWERVAAYAWFWVVCTATSGKSHVLVLGARRSREASKHRCRRWMRSTECTSSY